MSLASTVRRIFVGGDHVNDHLRRKGGVVRCDRCGASESVASALVTAGPRGDIDPFCPTDGCPGIRSCIGVESEGRKTA